MKLSNKEKIILAVFLAVVIIVAGIFVIILPEYNKIDGNQKALDAAKAQRQQLYDTLAREDTIDNEIETAIKNANVFSGYFYDDMTTYEADGIVRKILEETNMKTNSLSIGDFSTSTLTVSEYVETIVTYPLKEYSGFVPDTGLDFSQYSIQYDENGNIIVPDELKDYLKEFINTVLTTQQQTLGSITVSFTVEGTRGDFLKFLNYVAELEQATYIPSVSIDYTGTASGDNNNNAAQTPEEGNEDEETPPAPPADNGTKLTDNSPISANISMTLYCAKALQTEASTGTQTPVVTTEPQGEAA